MADRQDPSQYVFTGGPADGTAALPNVDMHNDQLQHGAEYDYADGPEMLELIAAPDHGDVPDLLHEHPGRFFTQGLRPVRPITAARPVSAYGGYIIPGDGLLNGATFRELAGAPAVICLRDGADASAPLLAALSLAAGEAKSLLFPLSPLRYRYGIFVELASGSADGVLYTADTEDIH